MKESINRYAGIACLKFWKDDPDKKHLANSNEGKYIMQLETLLGALIPENDNLKEENTRLQVALQGRRVEAQTLREASNKIDAFKDLVKELSTNARIPETQFDDFLEKIQVSIQSGIRSGVYLIQKQLEKEIEPSRNQGKKEVKEKEGAESEGTWS